MFFKLCFKKKTSQALSVARVFEEILPRQPAALPEHSPVPTYQSLEVARRGAGMAFENLPLGSIMQASRCDNFLPTSFFSCTMKLSKKKTPEKSHLGWPNMKASSPCLNVM